jgi:hypothetical protein
MKAALEMSPAREWIVVCGCRVCRDCCVRESVLGERSVMNIEGQPEAAREWATAEPIPGVC